MSGYWVTAHVLRRSRICGHINIVSGAYASHTGRARPTWHGGPGTSVRHCVGSRAEGLGQTGLPSEVALQRASAEASLWQEGRRIAASAAAADTRQLLGLLDELTALHRAHGAGDPLQSAWGAAAQRCSELSRTGGLASAGQWAHVLDAFALSASADPALIAEAEVSLAGGDGPLSSASGAELGLILGALSALAPRCSDALLAGVAARVGRLRGTSDFPCADVACAGALAGAFAQAELRCAEVVSTVLETLSTADWAAVRCQSRHSAVASIALFCHAFGIAGQSELGGLVPCAVAISEDCNLGNLSKMLPLLAAHGSWDARAAARRSMRRRVPLLLGARTSAAGDEAPLLEEASAIPRVLQAMGLARAHDLGTVHALVGRALKLKPQLGLPTVLQTVSALERLRVRHEPFMNEMAEKISGQHLMSLRAEDVEVILHAWTSLRAPHDGLTTAIREVLQRTSPPPKQALLDMLEEFASLELPGVGLLRNEGRSEVPEGSEAASGEAPGTG